MNWIFQKLAKLAGLRLPVWVLALIIGAFCGGLIAQQILLRFAVDEISSLTAGNATLTASVESKTKENELLKEQMNAEIATCQEQLSDRAEISRILNSFTPNRTPATPKAPSVTPVTAIEEKGMSADGEQVHTQASQPELISYQTSKDVVDFINGKLMEPAPATPSPAEGNLGAKR